MIHEEEIQVSELKQAQTEQWSVEEDLEKHMEAVQILVETKEMEKSPIPT